MWLGVELTVKLKHALMYIYRIFHRITMRTAGANPDLA